MLPRAPYDSTKDIWYFSSQASGQKEQRSTALQSHAKTFMSFHETGQAIGHTVVSKSAEARKQSQNMHRWVPTDNQSTP